MSGTRGGCSHTRRAQQLQQRLQCLAVGRRCDATRNRGAVRGTRAIERIMTFVSNQQEGHHRIHVTRNMNLNRCPTLLAQHGQFRPDVVLL